MSLFSEIVPSREICEELAKAGICQDDEGLFWSNYQYDEDIGDYVFAEEYWRVIQYYKTRFSSDIIAPTLPRMMDQLPDCLEVYKGLDGVWHCFMDRPKMFFDVTDKHLPNAVAKALLAIKKG